MNISNLKVSIITISKNCINSIKSTVRSVIDQTYEKLEYIVIDGSSSDGTYEWLKKHEEEIDVLISEPDEGIYDAMNKGLGYAKGDYVIFLNAGDRFVDNSILERILTKKEIIQEKPVIISGRIELALNQKSLGLYRPWNPGKEGPGLPHPATFIDRRVHKENLYDRRLNYCGDYELWLRLKSKGLFNVHYIPEIVSLFDIGGVSNSPRDAFNRYMEKSFINYTYSGSFGYGDVLRLLLIPLLRQTSHIVLGQRGFVTLLRYRRLLQNKLHSLLKSIKRKS